MGSGRWRLEADQLIHDEDRAVLDLLEDTGDVPAEHAHDDELEAEPERRREQYADEGRRLHLMNGYVALDQSPAALRLARRRGVDIRVIDARGRRASGG